MIEKLPSLKSYGVSAAGIVNDDVRIGEKARRRARVQGVKIDPVDGLKFQQVSGIAVADHKLRPLLPCVLAQKSVCGSGCQADRAGRNQPSGKSFYKSSVHRRLNRK